MLLCESCFTPGGRFSSLFNVSSAQQGQSGNLRTEQETLELTKRQCVAQGHFNSCVNLCILDDFAAFSNLSVCLWFTKGAFPFFFLIGSYSNLLMTPAHVFSCLAHLDNMWTAYNSTCLHLTLCVCVCVCEDERLRGEKNRIKWKKAQREQEKEGSEGWREGCVLFFLVLSLFFFLSSFHCN